MTTFHSSSTVLEEFLANSSDIVHLLDSRGTILYANPRSRERLGYQDTDAVNFFDNILHLESHESFRLALESLKKGENPDALNCVLLSHDGASLTGIARLIMNPDSDDFTCFCLFEEVTRQQSSHIELERMFSMSNDLLGVIDFEGKFVRANPAFERILGYSPAELVGQHFQILVHPDDVQASLDAASQQPASSSTFDNRLLCKDGSIRWLSWYYISYDDLQQTYFVGRDITDERSNRELLREARDRLQAILDNSGTMIGLKNLDGKYILVNQEFADIFADGDKTALLGRCDDDIFSQSFAVKLAENEKLVIRAERTLQFEETIKTADRMRTYLTTRFQLFDVNGNAYALGMIAKDITYRKLTEMQLLMRNQAIEHSPTGISIADARLPDMPLIYINPAFEKNTGYTSLDVIGRNCRFLQNDDRDQPGVHLVRNAIQNEQSVNVVIRNYRKDGTLFYNALDLAPIHNDDGELTHYVGISTDVTERIETEAKIQKQNQDLIEANADLARARKEAEDATTQLANQNQALIVANRDLAVARKQAEDATRLKSEFLATMSHELRTPLNAIIGYTEIQLAGMTGEITDEQRDYQERVVANAEHLLNLINDVLDISRIEAGRMELVNKSFNLRDWLLDIDSQVRGLAERKSLDFIMTIDSHMPGAIVGDAARIKQIAINLLSNAIKFTEQGSVRLNIGKQEQDTWYIIVEDTGIGIAPHMQDIIFEEFRQIDSTSRRKIGGTGLGLSIVRKLLLIMGGKVRLNSQLGKGSTFTITLPLITEGLHLSTSDTGDIIHD